MIREMRHVGIVVKNMEKNLRFWRDVMGLSVKQDFWEEGAFIDTIQDLEGVKLHMIKLTAPDDSMIELLKDDSHPTPSPERNELCDRGIRHIAFTVDDVMKSWTRLHSYGCKVLSKPTVSPDGKAKLFFARDPEGNLLELVEMVANKE